MMLICRRLRWKRILFRTMIFFYSLLFLFSLFNFKSHVRFQTQSMFFDPVFTLNSDSHKCYLNPKQLNLVEVDVNQNISLFELESLHPELEPGGTWKPPDCVAWQKVAVIVPYRDRWTHLLQLLKRLIPLLQKQKLHYRIFVIEQARGEKFNRARLLNIGVLEALKFERFDCLVFHDVDLLPEHDQNLYYCDEHARHLASAIDEMRYHNLYYNYAGGVLAIQRKNFFRANGYSNKYWGWGNEDDDFNARTQAIGLLLTKPPENIGRYKMIRHSKDTRAINSNGRFLSWRSRWMSDGINNLQKNKSYMLMEVELAKLFTRVLVDIGKMPALPFDEENNQNTESWLWFLQFYFP